MADNEERDRIKQIYRTRQTRQLIANAAGLFAVVLVAVMYKRPHLFGVFSKEALFGAQVVCIAAFLGFTTFNWRCPACNAFLSSDIFRRTCKKCGAGLQ